MQLKRLFKQLIPVFMEVVERNFGARKALAPLAGHPEIKLLALDENRSETIGTCRPAQLFQFLTQKFSTNEQY